MGWHRVYALHALWSLQASTNVHTLLHRNHVIRLPTLLQHQDTIHTLITYKWVM